MKDVSKIRELRSFGLTVGGVFLAIGLWPVLWSGAEPRIWALAAGSLLALFGGLWPSALKPLHRGWMALGHLLGWVNTRIVLGLFFYGILTPVGVVAKWAGKDFLRLHAGPDAGTYRIRRAARPVTHVRHQF